MIRSNEYVSRRDKIIEGMEINSLAILFSGVEKSSSGDATYPFEVNRNFYYLTGIDQPDSVLLLAKLEGETKIYLLISPFDPVKEKWYGKRLTVDESKGISGINNVLINNALNSLISSLNDDCGGLKTIYLDLEKEIKIAECTSTAEFSSSLSSAYPNASISDIYQTIVNLRMVKSKFEIEEMTKAIEDTHTGIRAVMALAKGGLKEYELATRFFQVINDESGYQGTAFNTIMASGKNATCLHYPNPQSTINDGELLLMDLGSRNNYYNADVTRTIPIGGKFSPIQKTIYEIVLGANKAVANFAKPGLSIRDLQAFTKEYLASECLEKGLIKTKEEIDNYYYHNVSHHIGLDTHDPGSRETPLVEGNVISDEPGLYFANLGIGVRIEDDLLITKTGAKVLTSDIMKEVSDIERFYGKNNG